MRGDEAKRVCSGINLVQVPVARGKANLNLYRSAGAEVGSPSLTNLLQVIIAQDLHGILL